MCVCRCVSVCPCVCICVSEGDGEQRLQNKEREWVRVSMQLNWPAMKECPVCVWADCTNCYIIFYFCHQTSSQASPSSFMCCVTKPSSSAWVHFQKYQHILIIKYVDCTMQSTMTHRSVFLIWCNILQNICLCFPRLLQITDTKNDDVLWCDNDVIKVWLDLSTKITLLRWGKNHGLGSYDRLQNC